jgi:N utilization substance protein B
MGRRRKARELALQSLYELECPDKESEVVLRQRAAERGSSDESLAYARLLLQWVRDEQVELDDLIAGGLEHWDLERVSLICRLVLRLAMAEGRRAPDVPARVILDEAIELARKYDSDEGARFINGVLEPLLFDERGGQNGRSHGSEA